HQGDSSNSALHIHVADELGPFAEPPDIARDLLACPLRDDLRGAKPDGLRSRLRGSGPVVTAIRAEGASTLAFFQLVQQLAPPELRFQGVLEIGFDLFLDLPERSVDPAHHVANVPELETLQGGFAVQVADTRRERPQDVLYVLPRSHVQVRMPV